MRRLVASRFGHCFVLLSVASALAFPELGAPSLWDDDEGVNAECAREMSEVGTHIVPLFNWELRTAKPIFLYWLLQISYDTFGVNEFAARLPSALAYLGTVLLTYGLGRRMFDATTGLLAGLIAASSLELVKLGHACTPDSVLVFFLLLYFWAFWRGHEDGRRSWYLSCGAASALAMLTKGPVGLVLPIAVVAVYLLWHREVRRLFDPRMIGGTVVWILVAVPWYAIVTAETKGEWTWAFFLKENLGRSAEPMENHRGPWIYYLGVAFVFFAPWSAFLIAVLRDAWRRSRLAGPERRAVRFLMVWIVVVFALFTPLATKLPHYIAPAYPALAILTASYLVRWMRGEFQMPRWVRIVGIAGFALTGSIAAGAMLVAGGAAEYWEFTRKLRDIPGLEWWAPLGLLPILGALGFAHFARRDRRRGAVGALVASTVLFVGLLVAEPPAVVDRAKAVKVLVAESGADDLHRDVRVGSHEYSQPSITFYVGRKVERLRSPEDAAAFLAMPYPSYLFVTAPQWEQRVERFAKPPYRIAARRYDTTRNCDVLVVVNDR